jgi:hypothetical protein
MTNSSVFLAYDLVGVVKRKTREGRTLDCLLGFPFTFMGWWWGLWKVVDHGDFTRTIGL